MQLVVVEQIVDRKFENKQAAQELEVVYDVDDEEEEV